MTDNSGAGERKREGSFAWPYILIFVILSTGIGFAAHHYYFRQKAQLVSAEHDELSAVVDLKVREISQWIEERKEDGQAVLENPFFTESLRRLIESPRPLRAQRDAILHWMESLVRTYHYSGVAVFAPEGTAVLQTGRAAPSSLSPGERDLLRDAEREGRAVLSDLERNAPGGEIFMDALIPIRRPAGGKPGAAGYVVLRIDPSSFLYPLIQSWPTPSRTSETLLVRQEGDQVLYLNELRHRKNTALNLSLPLGANSLPAATAIQGKEGIVEGVDYRGVPVMAAVRHIPGSPWFLVAKVDRDEVFTPLRRQLTLLLLVCFGLVFAAGGGMASLVRRQQLINLRQVHALTAERLALSKHYEYLTKYANDIIILVNGEGRIVEANDRAVEAYGWSREELFRLGLKDLRPHDDPGTVRESIRRLRESDGRVFESTHVHKNGTTFPVEISARLIKIEGEEFYQEIIRDITDRKGMEMTLRWQHALVRSVLESAPASICSLDTNLRYTSFNQKHARDMKVLYGTNAELGGRFPDCITVAEDRTRILEELDRVLKGENIVGENVIGDKALSRGFFNVSRSPIQDLNGKVIGVVIMAGDISERKRAEEKLRESEEKYRNLVERLNDGITIIQDGIVKYVNPSLARMWGRAPDEVIGTPFQAYLHPDSAAKIVDIYRRRIAEEVVPAIIEMTLLHRDGTKVIAEVSGAVIDYQGKPADLVVGRNITERKRIEETLRQERDRARTYFEVASVIFLALQMDGSVSLINKSGCEILGYPEAEIVGKNWFDHFVPERLRESVKDVFKQMISGELPPAEFYENAVLTRTGEEKLIAWHNVLLKDETGHVSGTLSSGEDITLRRRAEEEIRRLNVELEKKVLDRTTRLEAANKELEAFTYSVSHDLRAPLRRIDGFGKILLDDYGRILDDQGKDYLARMRTGTQHMAQLIDDLLTLSRISLADLRRVPVDLSGMARTITDSLQAEHPERRVHIAIQDGLSAEGDSNLIRILMENLLDNAWKFTGQNPDARVEFGMTGQAGERVFYVRDNGVGFDMAYAEKLFAAFQRLHSLHEFPGTGIGLATVQRIINRHGGRVWAEGSPGNGATFFFKL